MFFISFIVTYTTVILHILVYYKFIYTYDLTQRFSAVYSNGWTVVMFASPQPFDWGQEAITSVSRSNCCCWCRPQAVVKVDILPSACEWGRTFPRTVRDDTVISKSSPETSGTNIISHLYGYHSGCTWNTNVACNVNRITCDMFTIEINVMVVFRTNHQSPTWSLINNCFL